MNYRNIFLLTIGLLLSLTLHAQKLTVESMQVTNDLSASQFRRVDRNNEPCGLVKVSLATTGATFEGNVIQPVEYKTGEYWVYMTKGSRELRIKHPSFVPLHVNFEDYGIKGVQSLTTYGLTLLMPQTVAPVQTQKLTINYSPANAMVLIDSQPHQGNGHIELTLPVGTHNYQVVAMGYETAEGSVKLTASAPRTVTEHLVATQQTPAQPVVQETLYDDFMMEDDKPAEPTKTLPDDQQTASPVVSPMTVLTPIATPVASNSAIETITVNGVSFNMVRVDGGTFTMGATSEQGSDAYDDEKPAHQVTLSTYSIGETEVTQELWQAVMGSNPSQFKGDQKPVEQVSWNDCQTFISKLNQLTGRRFRLPTEAEWEYAARGGSKSRGYKYSGSNSIGDVAWYDSNSSSKTHPVKTKQANELGLYDMSGNVDEWCQDRYGDYSSGSQTNPTGPSSGSDRVSRGGCWGHKFARYCRVANRSYCTPDNRYSSLGLRLAL